MVYRWLSFTMSFVSRQIIIYNMQEVRFCLKLFLKSDQIYNFLMLNLSSYYLWKKHAIAIAVAAGLIHWLLKYMLGYFRTDDFEHIEILDKTRLFTVAKDELKFIEHILQGFNVK